MSDETQDAETVSRETIQKLQRNLDCTRSNMGWFERQLGLPPEHRHDFCDLTDDDLREEIANWRKTIDRLTTELADLGQLPE